MITATRTIMGTLTITATRTDIATATTTRTITDRLRALLVGALLCATGACGEPVEPGSAASPRDGFVYGRVTRVADGDTLTMQTTDGRSVRIRLAEIDTPEQGEPFSDRARAELSRLVRDRDIAVRLFDVDSYGRIVGRVFVNGLDVNAALVEQGLAVVYRRWAEDQRLYELEARAREARRGLWSGTAIPRGAGRSPGSQPPPRPAGCGAKRSCAEMSSCEEALFYLRQCDASALDGDGDGVPCEWALCR